MDKKDVLLTSGTPGSATANKIEVNVKGATKTFRIEKTTNICVHTATATSRWQDLKGLGAVTLYTLLHDDLAFAIRDGGCGFAVTVNGLQPVDEGCKPRRKKGSKPASKEPPLVRKGAGSARDAASR
jgi:hypothetical protein